MPKKSIQELKQYFQAGKRPTESQFWDLLDSYAHLDGNELARIIENVNTENGYLVFRSAGNSAIITKISLQDIKSNMGIPNTIVQSINGQSGIVNIDFQGSTDVGSTRLGIAKFFTDSQNGNDIFHIKLPYRIYADTAMFYIKAEGYSHGSSEIIDIVWAGYCYQPANGIVNNKTNINNSSSITAGQYSGSDGYVYLWFKVPNPYYTTFKLDTIRVGNGTLLQEGDVQIILSDQPQL